MAETTNPRKIEAIVKRLRYGRHPKGCPMLCPRCEAADAIEQLLEQRKRVLQRCDESDYCAQGIGRAGVLSTDEIRAALEEPCKRTNS